MSYFENICIYECHNQKIINLNYYIQRLLVCIHNEYDTQHVTFYIRSIQRFEKTSKIKMYHDLKIEYNNLSYKKYE